MKNMNREKTVRGINSDFDRYKEVYYNLQDIIINDGIYSKLPQELIFGIKDKHSSLIFLKNLLLTPLIVSWKIFLIRLEYLYYKTKYPNVCTLQDILTESFDYLFVLNTRDHTITALPVLESMENKAKCLVVTFKSVYTKYQYDFDKLKSTKIIFFDYELKNLALTKYLSFSKESRDKFRLLKSQNLDSDLKRLIELDKNFILFHLKTELVQYYFFEKVFNTFDIKGAVSIVFTTAFELCKERGIPTFVLQHGIGGKGHGHPYVSDYWFTLDDVSKDSLDEWLDHTVNVLALGSPRYEFFKNAISSQRNVAKFNAKIGSTEHKVNVTYISSGTRVVENRELIMALKKLRERLPNDANLIIKLHPRGEYNVKVDIKTTFSKNELRGTFFILQERDFYEILANSDVVITRASTGMLEAIAADIPTLQVNFTDVPLPKQYNLSSFGWKEPINDPAFMINETVSILSDTKRYEEVIEKQKWLKNRMFTNFGNCGKVIADTIINICNDRSNR